MDDELICANGAANMDASPNCQGGFDHLGNLGKVILGEGARAAEVNFDHDFLPFFEKMILGGAKNCCR